MHTLSNQLLKITIRQPGAELCKITAVNNNIEFMWNGNPEFWSGIAPTLFPIVGCMKDDTYIFEGETYNMPKHGFFRKSEDVVLHKQTTNSLTYKLASNAELLKLYPFAFEFYITYTLTGNIIDVKHTVKNRDSKTLYFSLGGHPAFKCPVYEGEDYSDYRLAFEKNETSPTHLLDLETGLYTGDTEAVFNNTNHIDLHPEIFNKDALVFKDLKSRAVTLESKTHGNILTLTHKDFPHLGTWAKPHAPYVCIEPWIGYADNIDTDHQLTTKEGIVALDARKEFNASYQIEIYTTHLK